MVDAAALAPPPRPVPWSLRLQVLGSGMLPLLGWIFLGIGLLFAWLFLRQAEPLFGDPFGGQLATVDGQVLAVESTGARVNENDVHAVRFRYEVGGRSLEGTSYTSGATPAPQATVPVEFVRADPTVARVRGMRTAMFPAMVWLVLLFPGAGAVLLLVGLGLGWRRVHLLQHGVMVRGHLVASRPTNMRVNKQRVHELTFRYLGTDGREHDGTVRTHQLQDITDEDEEALLHDPATGRIVLWDMLPRRPELDRDGQFLPVGLGGLWFVLLPPTVIAVVVSLVRSALAA